MTLGSGNTYIINIRQSLGKQGDGPQIIQTIHHLQTSLKVSPSQPRASHFGYSTNYIYNMERCTSRETSKCSIDQLRLFVMHKHNYCRHILTSKPQLMHFFPFKQRLHVILILLQIMAIYTIQFKKMSTLFPRGISHSQASRVFLIDLVTMAYKDVWGKKA